MDYRYIEQLLERYWACETSIEEERILQAFFAQEKLPQHLAPYKALFSLRREAAEAKTSDDFEARVCRRLNIPPVVRARRLRFIDKIQPFFRAAASVAIAFLLGSALHHAFTEQNTPVCMKTDKEFVNSGAVSALADTIPSDSIKSK